MSFFDEVGKKITDVGQGTIQKTKNMADVAKLNSVISEEEQKIKSTYEQIGQIYVQKYRQNPEPDLEAYVRAIVLSEQKIAESNHSIQELKGMVACSKCGAMVDKDAAFCPTCGNAMPVKEKTVVAASFCTSCGAAVVPGQKFCVSCGAPVVGFGTTPVQQSQPAQNVATNVTNMQGEATTEK